MADNKGLDIKSDDKNVDTAPTPQNTPIFTAPLAAAAAAGNSEDEDEDSAPRVNNPALLNMLQGRLGSLVGASSGYVESLPKVVRERVDSLRYLQQQHVAIDKQMHLEIYELEKKFSQLYAPLYERRTAIVAGQAEPTEEEKVEGAKIADAENEDHESGIKEDDDDDEEEAAAGIPEFWLTALNNHPQVAELITERDQEAVKFLRNISLEYLTAEPGFKLLFEFAENPFFSNSVLVKTYYYEQSEVSGILEFKGAEGTEINWKPENDLSVTIETKKQRHKTTNRTRVVKKTVPSKTFFSFFTTVAEPESDDESEGAEEVRDSIEVDYELAEEFKDKIIPNAVDWFTGKALEYEGMEQYDDEFMDDYDDYEEDDDEEDSDEDDDKDDGLSRSVKEAAEPPQCKNQ
ncbi:histone chaperone [Kickxella alabastrina]|uniref:Histone chaperone n=1 Tax=Kickxella alabastrina TaxID=61397 RepID=A0ACC1ITT4_9FUNG|nr:histone chaperone [Kickxella alabastrina]